MLDDDRQQLDRVVALVQEVLREDLVGAYLFGSAVLGGLRPRSDLDVLTLSRRPTTREEKNRIVDRLLAISGRKSEHGRRRRVELTIVAEPDVKPWRYPPRLDFQYGDWWRREFESGNFQPWPAATSPDLAVLITMAVQADTPLAGPPPADAFDGVPPDDLVRAMADSIDPLLGDLPGDTANVLLTLARIWTTLATGVIEPKHVAANWALERLPAEHRPLLARAREVYVGSEDDRWDDELPRARLLADHVMNEIARNRAARW